MTLRRDRMARRNQRPRDVIDRLVGRRVEKVGRRGKFLIIDVEGDLTWVIHLGMSGRMRVVRDSEMLEPHAHLVVTTDRGDEVRLIDPRTFGFVAVFTPEELAADSMAGLGRDALDDLPTAAELARVMGARRATVKTLLLDQHILAGLGNIYADEVLFRAGIRPTRAGGDISPGEVEALVAAIPEVLMEGLAMGGTSLDDLAYLLPDGRAGEYLHRLRVYGRTDQPCLVCGNPIERMVIGARASHFCPRCQT